MQLEVILFFISISILTAKSASDFTTALRYR